MMDECGDAGGAGDGTLPGFRDGVEEEGTESGCAGGAEECEIGERR